MNALAVVCATLKGTPPHVFAEAWAHPEYGLARMQIDIAVVGEICDRIAEQAEKSNKKKSKKGGGNLRNRAKSAVARRNQRRG